MSQNCHFAPLLHRLGAPGPRFWDLGETSSLFNQQGASMNRGVPQSLP